MGRLIQSSLKSSIILEKTLATDFGQVFFYAFSSFKIRVCKKLRTVKIIADIVLKIIKLKLIEVPNYVISNRLQFLYVVK